MRDDMRDESDDKTPNEPLGDDTDAFDARDSVTPTDLQFDRWLPQAARDYNRPPASVPREEMWSAIASSIAASHNSASQIMSIEAARSHRAPMHRWQMAAAAVLLLGAGIAIGTRMQRPSERTPAVATGTPDAASTPARATELPNAAITSADSHRFSPGTRNQLALAPHNGASGEVSYARVTVDHFSRAEALLTSFKRARSDSADASLERWAQDLLADTRLLLDSPAADDTRRRRLLEDLELVLAQIVQLRAESSADRSLVRKSIERGEVLSRIRTTIPAGSASGV